MYPDLCKGLGLKNENLSKYDMPLVGFDGQMEVLEGQISLLVNMEGKEVMVTFIMVSSFSLYTTRVVQKIRQPAKPDPTQPTWLG